MKSVNFDFLASGVGRLIGKLSFSEEEARDIQSYIDQDLAPIERQRESIEEANERKRKKLREELSYLSENRLPLLKAGVFTPEGYVAEEDRLQRALRQIDMEDATHGASTRDTIECAMECSELLKSVALAYDFADPTEKDRMTRSIFSELTLARDVFDYQCVGGFGVFASRFLPNCDLKTWLSELSRDVDSLQDGLEKLQDFIRPAEQNKKAA